MTEPRALHFELAKVLGLRGLSIGDSRCAWGMTIADVHMNPYGVVHGGLLFTLVDYAMGGALTSTLQKGGRIAVMEAKVTVGETLLAVATGTFYILSGPD